MYRSTTHLILKSGAETRFHEDYDDETGAEESKKDFISFMQDQSESTHLSAKENYGIVKGDVSFYLVVVEKVTESKNHEPTYTYTEK